MKYLKTFENIFDGFKVGDIVICIRPGDYIALKKNKIYLVTKAEDDLISVNNYITLLNRTRFRLATPEEIEEYELKSSQNKFNL